MFKMYDDLAEWWPLLSPPSDYEEATFFQRAIEDACETLLSQAGFEPHSVPFEHTELEPGSHEIFIARKRSA